MFFNNSELDKAIENIYLLQDKVHELSCKIARLEGKLQERDRWEERIYYVDREQR